MPITTGEKMPSERKECPSEKSPSQKNLDAWVAFDIEVLGVGRPRGLGGLHSMGDKSFVQNVIQLATWPVIYYVTLQYMQYVAHLDFCVLFWLFGKMTPLRKSTTNMFV